MLKGSIFISYSHKDKKEADIVDSFFFEKGIMIERDIREVGYAKSFIDFMKRIRESDFVIMLISRNYLQSTNCMYELLEVMKDEDYVQRIHPIILSGDLLYKPEGHIEIISFWQNKFNDLNQKISSLDLTTLEHLIVELKKIESIKANIGEFLKHIQYKKYLSLEEHLTNGFVEIMRVVGYVDEEKDCEKNDEEIAYSTKPYIVWKQEDVSHAAAKRYSITLILNEDMNKAKIREVIQEVTQEYKNRNYYRNELVENSFKCKQADVVWLYVARDIQDVNMSNWLCRAQWIDEKLNDKFKPSKLSGDDTYNGIVINWNKSYLSTKEFYDKNTSTKNEFMKLLELIVPKMIVYANELKELYNNYVNKTVNEKDIINYSRDNQRKVNELYLKYTNLPIPPIELEDYARACDQLVATIDNMFLYYSPKGMETWKAENRNWLLNNTIKSYEKDLSIVEFELRKVHK